MKNTFFTLLTILTTTSFSFAQNGYTLEFEDVMTLSVETIIGQQISPNAVGSKSYTVPAGMVLKITAGCFSHTGTTNSVVTNLQIGSEVINYNNASGANLSWQPLWANAGSVLTLSYKNTNTTTGRECICGYITGTLFRKIAN
jgi:hypothetical protein